MAQEKPPVSFIGLGAMGFGMATHLVNEGYPVTGFDLYGPTLDRFKQAGGLTSSKISEAVSGKQYCVCMVATAQQAQAVLLDGEDPAIAALPQGAVLLLCSTVPCSYVQALGAELASRGRGDILLVDSPVSGGAGRAAAGTLSIMAGASDAAIDKGRALLQAMSAPDKLYIVKGGVGAGSNMKMCHQVLAANQILSASEALGFASRLGLDLQTASAAITKSQGWSWMFENRLPRLLDPNHQPIASAVTIITKDTGIITVEARRTKFATPMTSAAEQAYFLSLGRGWGADDDASLVRLYTEGKETLGPLALPSEAKTDDAKISLVVDLLRGIHLCSAAEALAFAHHVGLDLDQVFDLCINAAGGSSVLSSVGPGIIKVLQGAASTSTDTSASLDSISQDLSTVLDEAQRLKVPLFLGNAALSLIRRAILAGQAKSQRTALESIVEVWKV
jgi:3-hydroxyisobutyrate dehydrogenase